MLSDLAKLKKKPVDVIIFWVTTPVIFHKLTKSVMNDILLKKKYIRSLLLLHKHTHTHILLTYFLISIIYFKILAPWLCMIMVVGTYCCVLYNKCINTVYEVIVVYITHKVLYTHNIFMVGFINILNVLWSAAADLYTLI